MRDNAASARIKFDGILASVLTRDWLKRRELTETGGDNFPERFAFNDLLDQFIDPRGGRPLAALRQHGLDDLWRTRRLRTHPDKPRSDAVVTVQPRYQTPCTRP
jgi:hypothetical protein